MKSDNQIQKDLEKAKTWLQELIPNDHDKYDLEAKWDGSLSVRENKREILQDLLKLGLYKDEKALEGYAKSQEAKMIYERNLEALEEVKAYNEALKHVPQDARLSMFYSNLNRAVKKLVSGFSNALYVKGPGGIGKTYNIRNALLEAKAEFMEIRGDVTPAYLYRLAFENNTKVLYFNDTNKLLKNNDSLNMLKAMTELDGDRKVMKFSYSKQQDDLPSEFVFKGKVIFDYNYIEPSVRVDFEALISRGDYIELNFAPEDIQTIMRLLAKSEWQQEVTEWVIESHTYTGKNPLNLRTQAKAFSTYEYAVANNLNWKQEIEAELNANMSPIRATLYGLIGNRAVRVTDLVKLLLMSGAVNSIRTAYLRLQEWQLIGELHQLSSEGNNYYVGINPIGKKQKDVIEVEA